VACRISVFHASSYTVSLQTRQRQARTCLPAPGFGQCATITFGYRSSWPSGHRSGGISVTGAQGLYLRCHRLVAGEKAEERLVGTVVIGIAGDRTCEITHFETAISPYFGLPRTLNWIGIRRHAGLSF
jgi:hypothetical protein